MIGLSLSTIAAAFWNADERRLRAPWRLALTVALFAVAGTAVSVAASLLPPLALGSAAASAGGTAVTAGFVVLLISVAGRVLDRRTVADFGFSLDREWWVDFGFGLALGVALVTLIFFVELAAGWVRVEGFLATDASTRAFLPWFAASLVTFLAVGLYEELVMRGYLLTNVAESLAGYVGHRAAVAVAVAVSSGLFGLVHASNPNATLASTATISLAGVFLALGYVLTDELAIPVGIHVTWNFAQGTLYGFRVSGVGFGASVVDTRTTGPAVFTGGSFGPEAGLLGVAAVLVGCACVVAWVKARRGEVRIHPGVAAPDLRWRGRGDD